MAASLNHHFVPQYLFRLFNGGGKRIHLLRKQSQTVIFNASVRGQCARHKYYGDPDFEARLAVFDSRHATTIRGILREAWGSSIGGFTRIEIHWLLEAVLLQRARVPRTNNEFARNAEQATFYAFSEHLKASSSGDDAEKLNEAIKRGEVYLDGLELETLTNAIDIATRSVAAIEDLQFTLLRNRTGVPFIFGDCPCVLYNRYLVEVRNRGVLGYRTPGLMAFLPLDEKTQLMLYDPGVYKVSSTGFYVDISDVSDVSQLNAMQILTANDCVYFGRNAVADHLIELALAYRDRFDAPRSTLNIYHRGEMLIDGSPRNGEILHTFEHQLPICLALSFLETALMPSWFQPPADRNWEAGAAICSKIAGLGGTTTIEAIAAEVRANLRRRQQTQ